jgi:hypothetical protein
MRCSPICSLWSGSDALVSDAHRPLGQLPDQQPGSRGADAVALPKALMAPIVADGSPSASLRIG